LYAHAHLTHGLNLTSRPVAPDIFVRLSALRGLFIRGGTHSAMHSAHTRTADAPGNVTRARDTFREAAQRTQARRLPPTVFVAALRRD
jgi:hypothetical protein